MTTQSTSDAALRQQLVELLDGGGAHLRFDDAVADLPAKFRGQRPAGLPYSPWELIEHMRIAQWDILEFSRCADHVSPPWPRGYWPDGPQPPHGRAWRESITAFKRDNRQMQRMVMDGKRGLFEPFPWGDGQTLLREAMLVADHNSYHLGQLVVVRRLLGAWRE